MYVATLAHFPLKKLDGSLEEEAYKETTFGPW